jgi:hypothetical protein
MSELKFWEQEIMSFNKRLEEVVKRYTSNDIRARIEHFQNQFLLHNDVIDHLKKDVKKHEKLIAHEAEEKPVAIDHVHFEDHTQMRDRMDIQRKIYADLKNEYFHFLAKTM